MGEGRGTMWDRHPACPGWMPCAPITRASSDNVRARQAGSLSYIVPQPGGRRVCLVMERIELVAHGLRIQVRMVGGWAGSKGMGELGSAGRVWES